MTYISTVLVVLGSLLALVRCEFDCVCNYDVEKGVFGADKTTTIGYMYEFDCKPYVESPTSGDTWVTVAFEHQLGYIQKNGQVSMQTCPGDPPVEDILTTTPSPPSSTTSQKPTTAMPSSTQRSTTQPTTMPSTSTASTTTLPPSTSTTTPTPKTSTATTITTKTTTKATTTTARPLTTATPSQTTSTPIPTTTSTTTPVPTTTTTTSRPTTPTTTTTTATTTTPKTTQGPVTTTSQPNTHVATGNLGLCPSSLAHYVNIDHGKLFQYGQSCYEIVPHLASWSHAEFNCKQKGGHLLHIANASEQSYIYKLLLSTFNHPVWTGLHDRDHEEHFQWTSGQPVTFLNWVPGRKDPVMHHDEDCAVVVPSLHGKWDDVDCGADIPVLEEYGEEHGFICQFPTINSVNIPLTSSPVTVGPSTYTDGNVQLCPLNIRYSSTKGILGQYDRGCYELVIGTKYSWTHGENFCSIGGGHLAHISSVQEQNFIQSFLTRHYANHAVWIGLHDNYNEGHFEWTSGNAVKYTNWLPGHTNNFFDHNQEDCVVFVPYKNGIWDDIPCGMSSMMGDIGNAYAILCQYHTINSGGAIVGK